MQSLLYGLFGESPWNSESVQIPYKIINDSLWAKLTCFPYNNIYIICYHYTILLPLLRVRMRSFTCSARFRHWSCMWIAPKFGENPPSCWCVLVLAAAGLPRQSRGFLTGWETPFRWLMRRGTFLHLLVFRRILLGCILLLSNFLLKFASISWRRECVRGGVAPSANELAWFYKGFRQSARQRAFPKHEELHAASHSLLREQGLRE